MAKKDANDRDPLPYTQFQIAETLKLVQLESTHAISLPRTQYAYANEPIPRHQACLLMSFSSDPIQWSPPLPVTKSAADYLRGLVELPAEGRSRLEYFLPFLGSTDSLIADDAYNEFAKRPMNEIGQIRTQLDREVLIAILRDPATKPRLRSLAWMLLSLCGLPSDTRLFEEVICRRDLSTESIEIDLAASMACFIVLGGETSLRRIERDFLHDRSVSISNAHAAISAIRVVGQEFDCQTKYRLSRVLQIALARPEVADFVIPDLARWEDWTAFDILEQLFFDADEDTSFVRIPIINYMRLCPHPNASAVFTQMEKVDPNSARRAALMSGRGRQ